MTSVSNWFKELFHHHTWNIIAEATRTCRDPTDGKDYDVGTNYTMQCAVCGELRKVKL